MRLILKRSTVDSISGNAHARAARGILALAAILTASLPVEAQVTPGPQALLNSNGGTDSKTDAFPQLATDGSGHWVAVWETNEDFSDMMTTDADIAVSRSTNNGLTWTAPAFLNTNADTDSEDDRSPQIATDGGGNWVVVWSSDEDLGLPVDTDNDIFVATSTDNGLSWTDPAVLNTNGESDSKGDYGPKIVTDGSGTWMVVWESGEDLDSMADTDFDIFVSTSTDNGGTWTDPALVNANGNSDSEGDFWVDLVTDRAGTWMATWTSEEDLNDTAGVDRDIFVATSANNGSSWTGPFLLNTNGDTDSGDDRLPEVASDGVDRWVAVWSSFEDLARSAGEDEDVFFATSDNLGVTWTAPALLDSNGDSDNGIDQLPQVTTDGTGNWVAVWPSENDLDATAGTDKDILIVVSTDNGSSWTDPALLNSNGTAASGYIDNRPQVTTDGKDHWLAVWHSFEELGEPSQSDADIYVSVLRAFSTWVDFAFAGSEDGSVDNPFNTLAEAVAVAPSSSRVRIKGDTGDSTSDETLTLNQVVTIQAENGTVRIGDSGARSPARSGFVHRK